MEARDLMDTSFVLLRAEWTTDEGLRILEDDRPKQVIVLLRREDDEDEHYLLRVDEVLTGLGSGGPRNITDALRLDEHVTTPGVDASADAETAPPRAVVIESGQVVGYIESVRRGTRAIPKAIPSPTMAAPPVDGVAPDGPPEVNRTVVARFPVRVQMDEVAALRVMLSALAADEGGIPFAAPVGAEIDILVEARQGFAMEGAESGTLTVTGEVEGLPLLFKLRATATGEGLVVVFAFHQGHPLGKITLSPTVIQAAPEGAARQPVDTTKAETPLAPLAVHVPDLDMWIQQWPVGEEHQYSIVLTAKDAALELHLSKFGPIQLRMDPVRYFGDFFQEIEELPLSTVDERRIAAKKLEARGTGLFNTLFPPELQRLLWSLKDSIRSIWIQSEEPWIPWELCKLESEAHDPGPFLCEYSITRWVPGIGTTPTLSLDNVGVVVPADSGLPFAETERTFLESLGGNGRRVESIPADWEGVQEALKSGTYDCLHFTGHGAAQDENPDRARILLEQGQEFQPADVTGEAAKLGRAHPLVFLNACQVGRGGMSLTDIGGWANRFLEAKAGAFIGTYWSVFDEPAAQFTEALYPSLIGGAPIGEAVRDARAAIKPSDDPTWLAYTVFADPLASL